MSASAQQLPDRASLGFLRKQAKELHRTYVAGDPDAVARIRRHLPRIGGMTLS
jgi:hypothetical protein